MKKAVVVTGASTGIGYATVDELVKHGFHVFAGVRKKADTERLSEAFGRDVTPLRLDVQDLETISRSVHVVAERVGDDCLAGLVNNAGIAVTGPRMHMPIEDFQQQLDVNLTGALRVTQAFLPLLGACRDASCPRGRIVNMSSVSGRFAVPFVGAYAASKFGLEAISDALRRELSIYGIDVIVIEPGRIRTPIWGKTAGVEQYDQTDYGPVLKRLIAGMEERLSSALPVSVVSRIVLQALTHPRPRARYALPDRRLTGWILPRLLPTRLLDKLIAKKVFGAGKS